MLLHLSTHQKSTSRFFFVPCNVPCIIFALSLSFLLVQTQSPGHIASSFGTWLTFFWREEFSPFFPRRLAWNCAFRRIDFFNFRYIGTYVLQVYKSMPKVRYYDVSQFSIYAEGFDTPKTSIRFYRMFHSSIRCPSLICPTFYATGLLYVRSVVSV